MNSTDLFAIYDRIQADRVKENQKGLNDLKHLLLASKNLLLNDKGYNKMFEVIFAATVKHKALYARNPKGEYAARFSLCGSVLRAAIESAVDVIRRKTVKNVVKNILNILPHSGGLWEPISLDYLKSLRVIIEHRPHLEHIPRDEWEELVTFCCEGMQTELTLFDEVPEEEHRNRRANRGTPRPGQAPPSSESSSLSRPSFSGVPARLRSETEELLLCLEVLLQAPNARIVSTAQMTGSALLSFLTTHQNVTRVHAAAFSSMNTILAAISTNNIALAGQLAEEIPSVVSRLWDTKAAGGLREQMIVSMVYLLPHICSNIEEMKQPEGLLRGLQDLLTGLMDEYSNRMGRDQLQLEDIEFPDPLKPPSFPLALRSFMLRSAGKNRMELNWMVLQLIATLISVLHNVESPSCDVMDTSEPENEQSRRSKRRKLEVSGLEALLRDANSSNTAKRLTALQVLPFLVDEANTIMIGSMNVHEWLRFIGELCLICSEDNTVLSSWALLTIASGAFLQPASHPSTATLWQQIWQLCLRHLSNQPTCRTTCHLIRVILSLELIPYASIAKSIDNTIQSLDVHGPATLVDSALTMWSLILEKRRSIVHSAVLHPEEKLAQWLFSKWRPLDGLHRNTATTFAQMAMPSNILDFLFMCCDRKRNWGSYSLYQQQLGVIALAVVNVRQMEQMLKFLLLQDHLSDDRRSIVMPLVENAALHGVTEMGERQYGVQLQILEFLDRELGTLQDKWGLLASTQPKNVTPEIISNFTGFLLSTSAFIAATSDTETRRVDLLVERLRVMAKELSLFIKREDCADSQIDAVLEVLSPLLPDVRQMVQSEFQLTEVYHSPFHDLLSSISTAIIGRLKSTDSRSAAVGNDEMDIDDDFEIHLEKPRKSEKDPHSFPRTLLEASYSTDSAKNSTFAKLYLLATVGQSAERGHFQSKFIAFIREMPVFRLVTSKQVVEDFLQFTSHIPSEDISLLIQKFGKEIIVKYDWERCESVLESILLVLNALAPMWVPGGSEGDAAKFCADLYEWLVVIILDRKLTSYSLRLLMARVLERMLSLNRNFNTSIKSARSEFILLLEDEDARVKFLMAESVPRLFEIYPLSQHKDVFDDLRQHLEKGREWLEGLAMRCYALYRLASASHAIRRHAVYYLFEMATLKDVEDHATQAIVKTARALKLDGPQALFKIFSPQLIFTWISANMVGKIPFKACGYSTREELYSDIKEELAAQLFMRESDNTLQQLADTLGLSFQNVVKEAFHRIIAYCTAWAIATRPSPELSKRPPIDSRLKGILGEIPLQELYRGKLPLIIATLFQVMEQEGTSERLLSRDPALALARDSMKDIISIAFSEVGLPEPQKPSFKVRFVLHALHHITDRLQIDACRIWTPPTFTFVARKLLDTIDPGLGPLHACTVVRKIRLLVCLAGPAILEGYPLEMLIHSLSPFITDVFCVADTVGILQYLFSRGRGYLQTNPTFVVGKFLSVMASLSCFLKETVDSQHEASQFRESQRIAASFRNWLCEYVSNLTFPEMTEENQLTFRSIAESAMCFNSSTESGPKGSYQYELLRVLLKEEDKQSGFLDGVSKHLAFSLLSSSFERPQDFRDDIFGTDEESVSISKVLFRTCRRYNVSRQYLLWSARVLGRAYVSTGIVHGEWTREAEIEMEDDLSTVTGDRAAIPKTAIFKTLKGLLLSENRREAGLAEISLVDILYQELLAGETKSVSNIILPAYLQIALKWELPPDVPPKVMQQDMSIASASKIDMPVQEWITRFSITLSTRSYQNAVSSRLGPLLDSVEGLAEKLFPYLVHMLLLDESLKSNTGAYTELSQVFQECFKSCTESTAPHTVILIKAILYLRNQVKPLEKSKQDRDHWLDVDYLGLSRAATICKMFKTALLFVEIHCSQRKVSYLEFADLLLTIYKNIDDPDSFYGVHQAASLNSVLSKLEYEDDGWKSLSFRGAQMESSMRLKSEFSNESGIGAIEAFNTLGLNGLSHTLLQGGALVLSSEQTVENVFKSAWKLEDWHLPCPMSNTGRASIIYKALQGVNNNTDTDNLSHRLDGCFLDIMKHITAGKQTGLSLGASIRTLSMLTEVEEILYSKDAAQLEEIWSRHQSRLPWMNLATFVDVEEIISARQTTYSSLTKREHLRRAMQINAKTSTLYEAKALLGVCRLARTHKVLQHSLSAITQLNDFIHPCENAGLNISAVTTLETANVLWDQGEMLSAIRLLRDSLPTLENSSYAVEQSIAVPIAKILVNLGCWISEARLEKPEVIMGQYLEKAINDLPRGPADAEAGYVFHEFASFCDLQFNNSDNMEDYQRALKLREQKQKELKEIQQFLKTASVETLEVARKEEGQAVKWLRLDDAEFQRLRENREAFLEKSISNYLRALEACDEYNNDALRFAALWLEHSANEKANKAASYYLDKVPSRKFVPLMNQLSSRLLDVHDDFQMLLFPLIVKICKDHPYHGLYQILALTKVEPKDHTSQARLAAANKASQTMKRDANTGPILSRIQKSIDIYNQLALQKIERPKNSGKKYLIRKALPITLANEIERGIPNLKIPPPTMQIDVRSDCNYSHVPYLTKYLPEIGIASGLSLPKIITCQDSSGQFYKILVKGGTDDLRQDAIMEQVFEQVSHLLQRNRPTRQRNLGVRSYKVLPLGSLTGIIEFVPHTIPLHEYLVPAHEKYHPKDWKTADCRKLVDQVRDKGRDRRLEIFKAVCENFRPVMRYFFMHNFNGPDEWYRSRLAYIRSTAAISILGYVLGIGDRHGHNILLDEKSGEVVHIDLGIAFEQGRILRYPEVVPFRLTRDIVDGMGVTRTEGVFRRCCEFTLETLRGESYNIITILDVLRYDPLYNWTVSPVRMKKVQAGISEAQVTSTDDGAPTERDALGRGNTEDQNQEADRALVIVTKKLSKTLSVSATVNELIQQATDEKNLAVLFSGWAAWI